MTRTVNWTRLLVNLCVLLILASWISQLRAVRTSRARLAATKNPRGIERTFNLLNERDSNIFYLKEELELDDNTMMNIIRKHSWILYLDVETNLIPTIEALSDSGFTLADIRKLVAKVPSILGIDSMWTIPEKMLSLQQMFCLNTSQLCDVIVEQPMLLTSSIDRNYEVASFISDKIGLAPKEITKLMTSNKLGPSMAMTNHAVLSLSWSLLTEEYGFTPLQAKKLVKSYPNILSHRFLDHHAERVKFLEILGVSVESEVCRKLIMSNPKILSVDASFFLFSNLETMCEALSLPIHKIMKMVCTHPQLLTLHPLTLVRNCNFNMYLLTGMSKFKNLAVGEGDWNDDFGDNEDVHDNDDDSEEEYEDGVTYIWEMKSPNLSSRILEGNDEEVSLRWADMTSKQKRDERRAKLLISMSSYMDSDELSLDKRQDEQQEIDLLSNFQLQQNRSIGVSDQEVYEEDVVKQLNKHAIQENSQRILGSNYENALTRRLAGRSTRKAPPLWRASSKMSQQLSSEFFRKISFPLSLPEERGSKIISNVPWLLSYRPERTKKILLVLTVTLALTPTELHKCVTLYPRIFCLAIDGKISAVVHTLAHAAAEYLQRSDSLDSRIYTSGHGVSVKDLDLNARATSKIERYAILQARKEPIRRMVREVIVKFPLILGTSIGKIEHKLEEWQAEGAAWNEFVTILRTTEEIEMKRSISRALTAERKAMKKSCS